MCAQSSGIDRRFRGTEAHPFGTYLRCAAWGATALLVSACAQAGEAASEAMEGEPAQSAPLEAVDITREHVMTVLENMGESIDRQLKTVDIGAGNTAVGILRRTSQHDTDGEHRGIIHAQVTEVYYVLEGGGTLLTGGELSEATEPSAGSDLIGPTFAAQSNGGRVREIGPGDIVVIPAGTLHAFLEIPNEVVYLSFRVDPHSALPAGYVNPLIAP